LLRDYEITFVLTTTIDEETSAATVERVNQLIGTGGGTITEVHAWGRRHLAYPIQHQRDGFYVTTRFSMPPEAVLRLDGDLRLNEHILRHLVVRQDEVPIRPIVPAATQSAGAPVSVSAPDRAEISAESGDADSDLDEAEALAPLAPDEEAYALAAEEPE
jgi:small subunit ribosomal protein S6